MPSIFDAKYFNPEVFAKYVERVPRVKQNAFINGGIFNVRNDLRGLLTDQVGGNYITIPLIGTIGGAAENYDGNTDITADGIDTYAQSDIVVGRAHAFEEKDFTYDITGHDFMNDIAAQVSEYKEDLDNATILNILAGIYGVTTDNFAEIHTLDVTGTSTGKVTETTDMDAVQKAAGANRNIFGLAIMHSAVATNLEKMEVLEYRKQTDANGIQRTIQLADWHGKTVIVDDGVPVTKQETTAGVYKMQITTKAVAGDAIKINNVTLVAGTDFSLSTDTATGNAAAIATALNASTDATVSKYTWTSSSTNLIATEDTGYYGTGKFIATVTQTTDGTLAVGAVTVDTAPVVDNVYTTYILGRNAFDYCDVGAKVPYETDRNKRSKGGIDALIMRQRKLFAPRGFSFVMPTPAIISPTDLQLATAANWTVITNTSGTKYFDTRAIPFARILSKG